MGPIGRNAMIQEIFTRHPQTRQVFIKNSMRCFGCDMLKFATVEECCKNHEIKDVDAFVNSLIETASKVANA